jgi:hypothetical protein
VYTLSCASPEFAGDGVRQRADQLRSRALRDGLMTTATIP